MSGFSSARGNVLFMILIAVALFCALIFAISGNRNTMRRTGDAQEAHLAATDMIQFGDAVRVTLDKQLNIQANLADTNAALFTGFVLNPALGGIPLIAVPNDACTVACTYQFVDIISVPNVGTAEREAAMIVTNVTDDVCRMVNRIQNTGLANPPAEAALVFTAFNGIYTDPTAWTGTAAVTNMRSFCFINGTTRTFVHILRAR